MRKKSTIFCWVLISIGVFFFNKIHAQCLNQVSHIRGTTTVDGVNITVSSSGYVDVNTVYCPNVTEPYYLDDGSYTFQFSPAVDSVTLNFSGINDINEHKEIVKLIVNGSHYEIPFAGNLNGCDSLAVLTPSGDITGCMSCGNPGNSGWKGTTISETISSLTVVDSIVSGTPGGAIFSLFICDGSTSTGVLENELHKLKVFPNPATDILTITGVNIHTTKLSMRNILGQKTMINPITNSDQVIIDISDLSSGIYFIIIESNGIIDTRKVIIE